LIISFIRPPSQGKAYTPSVDAAMQTVRFKR
jgi:hypothetical protein